MSRRIIIENRSTLPDSLALLVVGNVIDRGRISNNGKQYCYATTFSEPMCAVYTDYNKCSDRFVVCDYSDPQPQEGE